MSNKGAQINVPALLDFNKTLSNFSDKMKESYDVMNRSIERLGADWKDDKYTEFKNEFNMHFKKLEPLSAELKRCKEHSETKWIPVIEKFLSNKVK